MSNKNKDGHAVSSPAVGEQPASGERLIDNGTTQDGGSVVSSTSLAVAVQSPEVVPVQVTAYLNSKANEINVIRATLHVRVGGVLAEVRSYCKEQGYQFSAFLARPDVGIGQDTAERCINVFKTFGKLPEADLNGIHFRKLTALTAIEEPEVRAALLSDPVVKDEIKAATVREIEAGVMSYKEKLEQSKRSIEGFREQLQAAKNAHTQEVKEIRSGESQKIKTLSVQLEQVKAELQTAQHLPNKADVDALAQMREQRDALQAQLTVLASDFDTLKKLNTETTVKAENVVTDKRLREDNKNLEAELHEASKALRAMEKKFATAQPSGGLVIEGVDIPSGFSCTLSQALTFLSERGLMLELVEWLGVQAGNNGNTKVAA